ncbi:MAG: choloylglycine hydrolase family protein [Candidatus Edwardsbacteria bacterium]|nr:choloylglycine hydrolase family protein [Candidatus Edwardsbacteria bacterium]MBU1577467.1 choloylglycine hydrolase family protein [Candidatus Edwardsbacteria bacterium]MBU2464170.1 choloylglycine hydrolase family protein [Candidatus Edwardsbacteria bacterium]MBU2593034.1 choloylglycine hydrolase family protein [Candidatus Edwardsbacteria bacterium]
MKTNFASRDFHYRSRVLFPLFLLVLLMFTKSNACTGIRLTSSDGTVVYGRTMEWGAFDLNSRIAIFPQGYEFIGVTPEGNNGKKWTSKYGFVGLDMAGEMVIADGLNEKGITVGLFYHHGFASYSQYNKKKRSNTIAGQDVSIYILSQFSTIDEVRAGINNINVVGIFDEHIGQEMGVHYMVTEPSGKSIVIEFTNQRVKIHDNPLGVITNGPNYDWHMTNLRNYINLSPVPIPTKKIENMDFSPMGGGSGFLGLPGDFTPPSRFVRAVVFSQTARNTSDGLDASTELFRILDNFNVPLGAAEGSSEANAKNNLKSSTLYTTVWDTKNLIFYYHTQYDRRVRMLNFSDIVFKQSDGKIKYYPMDKEKKQDMENVLLR